LFVAIIATVVSPVRFYTYEDIVAQRQQSSILLVAKVFNKASKACDFQSNSSVTHNIARQCFTGEKINIGKRTPTIMRRTAIMIEIPRRQPNHGS